jgi:hypothetical protein
MMAAGNAHSKAFRLQQIADFVEAKVSVGRAAKKLLKSFFNAHGLVQFHPTLEDRLLVDGAWPFQTCFSTLPENVRIKRGK